MSQVFWEDFFTHTDVSLEARELFMEKMTATNHAEAVSVVVVVLDTPGPEISDAKAIPVVPTMSRSPKPKNSMEKEKQKKPI